MAVVVAAHGEASVLVLVSEAALQSQPKAVLEMEEVVDWVRLAREQWADSSHPPLYWRQQGIAQQPA